MTEELMELLTNLQQVYGISEEDMDVLAQAIDTTVQEAVAGGAEMQMGGNGEGVPPEAMMAMAAEEEG